MIYYKIHYCKTIFLVIKHAITKHNIIIFFFFFCLPFFKIKLRNTIRQDNFYEHTIFINTLMNTHYYKHTQFLRTHTIMKIYYCHICK